MYWTIQPYARMPHAAFSPSSHPLLGNFSALDVSSPTLATLASYRRKPHAPFASDAYTPYTASPSLPTSTAPHTMSPILTRQHHTPLCSTVKIAPRGIHAEGTRA